MPGSLTDYTKDKLTTWITKGTSLATITHTYLALFTVPPTDAYTSGVPTGTECTGGSYARYANLEAKMGTSTVGQISNNADVTFATPTASWGTVTAVGIFDASTGGNLLAWAPISSRTVASGDTVTFSTGSIVVTAE